MRCFQRRAATALLAGALAAAAARAALTPDEHVTVMQMHEAAVAVEGAGHELMLNPALEPEILDAAARIVDGGRSMREMLALLLAEG